MLFDKTGASFELDHEHDGTAFVRPMVKVVDEYGDHVGEDVADYLVARPRGELFDAPPMTALSADIAEKAAELKALNNEVELEKRKAREELRRANAELESAKRQLYEWMGKHKVMIDLGKLIDGKTLYPLTVSLSPYHRGPEIPRIPEMRGVGYLELRGGDWETGKSWVCKQYATDSYGSPFQFFDTEEERAAVIAAEFEKACQAFRKSPDFSDGGRVHSTCLDFGRLTRWVEMHPALSIPDDIITMKAADDARKTEERKAKLAAELAEISK